VLAPVTEKFPRYWLGPEFLIGCPGTDKEWGWHHAVVSSKAPSYPTTSHDFWAGGSSYQTPTMTKHSLRRGRRVPACHHIFMDWVPCSDPRPTLFLSDSYSNLAEVCIYTNSIEPVISHTCFYSPILPACYACPLPQAGCSCSQRGSLTV
jgi:hypothetical protein